MNQYLGQIFPETSIYRVFFSNSTTYRYIIVVTDQYPIGPSTKKGIFEFSCYTIRKMSSGCTSTSSRRLEQVITCLSGMDLTGYYIHNLRFEKNLLKRKWHPDKTIPRRMKSKDVSNKCCDGLGVDHYLFKQYRFFFPFSRVMTFVYNEVQEWKRLYLNCNNSKTRRH